MRQQNTRLQSAKADLLLINEITKPSKISQLQAPSNMQELHNLLKFKNTKSGRSKQQKQNAQAWLNKEGIDISPLVERVKKARQISIQKQELKKIEEDCLFYIPDMSYKKIDQYLIKAHDYGAMNIIQKTMKKANLSKIIRNRINTKFAEISCIEKQQVEQRPLGLITSIKTQTRDDEKREKYLKCITAMSKNNIQRDELVYHISSTINKKFWKIFTKHVKCLNEYKSTNKEEKLTYLLLDSLQQVQDQYDSYLARGSQSLNYYLTSTYLEKLDKRQEKYIRDREHQAFWGKAFILYRAGRRKDFYNLLSTRNQAQLMKDFIIADKSIDEKNPAIISGNKAYQNNTGKDVFKEQLIYALKAEPKYSTDVLSDPTTLDFVWILLRNLGIFQGIQRENFESYKSKILQSYSKQVFLTEQQLYNYFYLLSYQDIAQLGLSDIMDQDDYLHFLICLNENPGLLGDKYERVQKLLTKQLMLYIRELISQGRSEYVYYMSLIPKQARITEISTLISSSNLVSTFNWQYLRSSIPSKEEFEQIVRRTLEKHILATNDYLAAAEKYIELLNEDEKAVRCLLQYLIKSFYNNSFADQIVNQAETACDRYLYRNPKLQAQFRTVLNFVIESRKLLELLRERKDLQIYHLVKNSQFILLGAVLPVKHQQFFDNLIELTEFNLDVYFKFLRSVIKGLEIYCLRQNRNSELIEFITLVEENLQFIFNFEKYRNYKNREEAASLRELINSTHYEVTQY